MATAFRTRADGLHHAVSLGNIDATSQQSAFNYAARNYDSEDENMGRLKARQQNLYNMKPPIYSKEDIIDQYCLTDRQLNNSIEAPRRDRFFGCWSTRSQQSFLGVCVGRRAPSDENLQDYAPISRHPRYQKPISYDEDDLENSYFRRKPTSFLSSNDAKRHTWMNDDAMRVVVEDTRHNRNYIENGGPYVVGSYPQKSSFLSQSTEQITGYRCPAHINLPSAISTAPMQSQQDMPPRTKHVSFARSLTLASFDDAIGVRQNRMINARSQERLIGGKKSTLTITQQPPQQQQQIPIMQVQAIPILQKPQLQQTLSQPHLGQMSNQQIADMHNSMEKQKRNVMKTQATQTEMYLGRKMPAAQTLSLSPRTVHRVKMVSQGAQTNGMNGSKKLTKSYSEMGTADAGCQYEDGLYEHDLLCRTQSEDSPKSPLDMSYVKPSSGYMMTTAEIHSQALSRQSQLEALRSNKINDNFYFGSYHQHHSHETNNRSNDQNFPNNNNNSINLPDNFLVSRRGSHTLPNEPIFIGRNELEQIRISRALTTTTMPYEFESHSLPRRTCIHHKNEEYTTHSLPRREQQHHHHYLHEHPAENKLLSNSHLEKMTYQDAQPSYVNMNAVNAETYSLSRRSSMQLQQQQVPSVTINLNQQQQQHQQQQHHQHHHQALQQVPPSDEMCSTCSSETESEEDESNNDEDEEDDGSETEGVYEEREEGEDDDADDDDEEKEIFIDFKPHLSPTSTAANTSALMSSKKKKKLIKAMSQGEILLENNNNEKSKHKPTSASEEDLKRSQEYVDKTLHYTDTPIRDEDIFKANSLFSSSSDASQTTRYSKETFRKRSISLEDPLNDDVVEVTKKASKNLRALSPSGSPGDGRSFASSDDITRDHSDGNWNESQVTILPCPPSPPDGNNLLTPSSKRKHLPHQQRSSLDVDAIDIEDIADQPLPPLPPLAQPMLNQQKSSIANIHQSITSVSTVTTPISTNKNAITTVTITSTPTGVVKPTPSIAVTHSQSIEREENALLNLSAHVRPLSPSKRKEMKKYIQHKSKHSAFDKFHRSNESLESTVKTSMESILNRNDASEGSTTEDYMTCTDNSKRTHTHSQAHVQGIRYTTTTTTSSKGTIFPPSHIIAAGAAVAATTHSSQNVTIEGSSFESASSFHSLARIDAICEDPQILDEKPKSSPAHSDSSTSSGSYRMPPMKISSPLRATLPKPMLHVTIKKNKKESVSDDERSEKFQSSSHDEKDHKTVRLRKPKEWNEEERRRKKGNFKLEIEKESLSKMPIPSTFVRSTSGVLKKISPEDKSALNVLDGTSPSKQKPRFRGKTRKTPRNRTPMSDEVSVGGSSSGGRRLSKTSLNKSPEKPSVVATPIPQQQQQQQQTATVAPTTTITTTKISPLKFSKQCHLSSPLKHHHKKSSSAIQRLKAISTESLRSVSPGSDSVFYNSEADLLEHQIHCHHCGKEVEVVTAIGGGSEESVVIVDDGPDIVQPPEGFADSPNGISKIPPALKYYKRFRSEDRRHKKGSNGRAKSEERGTEDVNNGKMKGSGSSPCVGPFSGHAGEHHDPEQGVYHASYSQGSWICIADKDFWRKNEVPLEAKYSESSERRASTESEKEFRKKYQAITHRLVHRKSCVEMYRRQSSNSFDTDKCVVVQRHSGEFGFRIHGSKPVVVSAIEKDTPAETSGLEVGDIVLSVNGISVVDKSHSEVVKIAHAGSDTLELEVARTMNVFSPVSETSGGMQTLFSGFLWRRSGQCESTKWIRRFFCLRTDQCLYYYKNETDVQPLGIILLTNHIVSQVPFEKSNRPFSFTIETSSESRALMLSTDTQDNLNGWIAILSHAAEQNDSWLDISTRNLKLPSASIIRPDCAGYLMKLGIRWRSWTKRYCVLKDACLYFYSESGSKSAIGMVCLQGYRVQPFATGGKKYAFELIPAEPKYRNYYFHTDTEMEKKRWVAALEYSIDRWMKAN